MAGLFRLGAARLVSPTTSNSLLQGVTQRNLPAIQQICHISGKSMRGTEKNRAHITPYDYKNKGYNVFHAIIDKTTHRFDDNSKIIVVEGPIASGKSKFAKELADELEMLYMPECNMDMLYINPYGWDMRQLDPKLPPTMKSFDITNFLKDPTHRLSACFQLRMYLLRYSQYIDALAHVLSTGQGVVLDRSVFSDSVFVEAMTNSKYISRGARSYYYEVRKNSISELFKPHLVIYLDVPVDTVKANIKKRNIAYEVNSKALTDQYLNDIDTLYKQQYLKEANVASELLVYDWSNGGETEVVVEDIERIDFDRFDKHDPKLKAWRLPKEWDWCEARMLFAANKDELMSYLNVPRFDLPELMTPAEDMKIFKDEWFDAPGMKYRLGYNTDMGDSGLLLKTKIEKRNNT